MFESIRRRNLDLLKLEAHLSSYQLLNQSLTCGFGSVPEAAPAFEPFLSGPLTRLEHGDLVLGVQ